MRGALVQMGPAQDRSRNGMGTRSCAIQFNRSDKDKAAFFESYLDGIRKSGLADFGAAIEVVAEGAPPGLGAPIYAKLDAELGAAMMSIKMR